MYDTFTNPAKLARALKYLKDEKKPETEEAVRALYLSYGGAIQGEPETMRGVPEGYVPPPLKDVEVEKPRKNRR